MHSVPFPGWGSLGKLFSKFGKHVDDVPVTPVRPWRPGAPIHLAMAAAAMGKGLEEPPAMCDFFHCKNRLEQT